MSFLSLYTSVAGTIASTLISPLRPAFVVISGITLLFTWLHFKPLATHSYLADSDLYEFFLPVFLAPITTWSSLEFAGMPAFADPQDTALYPIHFLFARIIGSWTGFVVAAFVLAACFTYAYVFSVTRSRVAATFAALMFTLSEAMLERLAHMTTLHAIAWLPLILLSIDRLRGAQPLRWMTIGTFAVASCMLGGHPQIVLYVLYLAALYALVGGLVERAHWRYWAAGVAMVGLAILLTAVKALPVLETRDLTARQSLDFAQFIARANSPAEMLSMLFPAVMHDGREAPTYVGFAGLIFALVGIGRSWRQMFWLAVALIGICIGLGDATPVARLAYHLPMYDNFRVSARHLILASFALSLLAGFGVAAVISARISWRRIAAAAVVVSGAVGLGAFLLATRSALFPLETGEGNQVQFVLVAVAAVACIGVARAPRSRAWVAALFIVLAVDLLHAQPWRVTEEGLDVPTVPAEAVRQPSVHAARLAAAMAPEHQRLLAPGGTHLDALLPAAFARVWNIPIAGGYGPMLLARHAQLAMMGTNGSIQPEMLSSDNSALDLLAVKFIAMRRGDLDDGGTTEHDGVTWTATPLHVPVGPPECGQRGTRRVSYALPSGVDVASIALVAQLRCSEDVPQGTEVARMSIVVNGERQEHALVAGVDIAETGLNDPSLQRRARHRPTRAVDPAAPSLSYYVRWDLPLVARPASLEIEVTGTAGWLELDALSVIDRSGRSVPQPLHRLLLNPERWRPVSAFETSRVSDRGADRPAAGEEAYVVYENLRARPRAWMTEEVVPLDDRAALLAIHSSRLPDGRPFDPATMAIVGTTAPAQTFPPGQSSVQVVEIGDGMVAVDVSSDGGGFLVLSESFYPGWRGRVDENVVPVTLANYSMQGVTVPGGRHRVTFELASSTLATGQAVSAGALVGLIALVGVSLRQRRT